MWRESKKPTFMTKGDKHELIGAGEYEKGESLPTWGGERGRVPETGANKPKMTKDMGIRQRGSTSVIHRCKGTSIILSGKVLVLGSMERGDDADNAQRGLDRRRGCNSSGIHFDRWNPRKEVETGNNKAGGGGERSDTKAQTPFHDRLFKTSNERERS